MTLESMLPGMKPKVTKKGLGLSLLSGGLIPPVTSRTTSDFLGVTKQPEIKTPPVPTIDTARQQQQETDRIRRRRGTYANIFAGASGGGSNAGTRQLLGGG